MTRERIRTKQLCVTFVASWLQYLDETYEATNVTYLGKQEVLQILSMVNNNKQKVL